MTGSPLDILVSQLSGTNLDRIVRRSTTIDVFLRESHRFTTSKGDKQAAICLMVHRHRSGLVSAYLPFIRLDGRGAENHYLLRPSSLTPATMERLRKHLRALGVLG